MRRRRFVGPGQVQCRAVANEFVMPWLWKALKGRMDALKSGKKGDTTRCAMSVGGLFVTDIFIYNIYISSI